MIKALPCINTQQKAVKVISKDQQPLVLFIFAHGVFTLFISDKEVAKKTSVLKWISTPNIGRLKNVLGEIIVIILFVKFLEIILINLTTLSWEILILPISIFMLAVSLKFLGLGREDKKNEDDEV